MSEQIQLAKQTLEAVQESYKLNKATFEAGATSELVSGVDQLVMAVDSGIIVNPVTASGQIEGGMLQALGYAVCEEMRYDGAGQARERDLRDYHIFQAHEMPDLTTIFVETFEPSHPFGVKAVAEIPMDGVAPAVALAVGG